MTKTRTTLPREIWALGLVSLFMDVASESVHSLLPLFLVSGLGASVFSVGLLEGLAEGLAIAMKVFSGPLSDWIGRRKPMVLTGYAMGMLSKPLFAVANTVGWVYAARLFDRVGKGIRGAPRDALIADLTPPALRGRAFGLRQSLDTVGAFIGPLLAIALMALSNDNYRLVFWIAAIPALLSVATLFMGVREPEHPTPMPKKLSWSRSDLRQFTSDFWGVAIFGAVFQLARFSEAFLILRAKDLGLKLAWAPLVFMVMNLVFALSSYPVGDLSDRVKREWFLIAGLVVLCVSDLLLGFASGMPLGFLGIALWGLHLGLTQGTLTALVADHCPLHLRGTAYGLFSLLSSIALLMASALAGFLWDTFGGRATFLTGAAFSLLSLVIYLGTTRLLRPASQSVSTR